MPESLHIRLAVPADADRLIPHINAAFARAEPFMTGPRTDPARLADAMHKGAILVAEDASGQLVASIYVEIRTAHGGQPTGGRRGYAGMLAVSPAQQRSGIGRRMMQAAEDYLRTRGCTTLDITVLSLRAELPPIYRAYGFIETGTEPFLYPHPLQDGLQTHCIVMSKPL